MEDDTPLTALTAVTAFPEHIINETVYGQESFRTLCVYGQESGWWYTLCTGKHFLKSIGRKLLHYWKWRRKEGWWRVAVRLFVIPSTMEAAFLPHHQAQKSDRQWVVNFLDRSNMRQGHDVEQKPWQNDQSPPLISLNEFDNIYL